MSDPDFGVPHGETVLVEDRFGTISKAFYENGSWWLGQKGVGVQEELLHAPCGLFDPASLETNP